MPRRFPVIGVFLLAVLNCAANDTSSDPGKSVRFEVLRADRQPGVKCSLDIGLDGKVSNDELHGLALRLRKSEAGQYPRFFISYYLPGMKVGAGAWATTHFEPELKVRVLGMTAEEETVIRHGPAESPASVLGRWVDETWPATIVLRRKNGRLSMEYRFRDGSRSTKDVLAETVSGQTRYRESVRNRFGEYYVIETSGDLAIYDRDGLVRVARRLE